MENGKQQAKKEGAPDAAHQKTINKFGHHEYDNRIDDQQKKPEGDDGNGKCEKNQNGFYEKVEDAQQNGNPNGGEVVIDRHAGQNGRNGHHGYRGGEDSDDEFHVANFIFPETSQVFKTCEV